MIFEVNANGNRTVFEHRDVGNPHQFSVIRHQSDGWVHTRYNTHEECAIQLVALANIHHGARYQGISSDHHRFEFKKEGEHVHIRCISNSGRDNDEFDIWGSEVHAWIWGYAKCIWEHDFERRDSEAIAALQKDRESVIAALGEVPPFLRKIPENQKRHEEEWRRQLRRDEWANFRASVFAAVCLCIIIGVVAVVGKLAYTGISALVARNTPWEEPFKNENKIPAGYVGLKPTKPPDTTGLESRLNAKVDANTQTQEILRRWIAEEMAKKKR